MAETGTIASSDTYIAPRPPEIVLDNVARVTTPENIAFQYQIVGPFRRVIAYGLDILFSAIAYFCLVLVLSLLFSLLAPIAEWLGFAGFADELGSILEGLIMVGIFVVGWFYAAVMETYFNGQTIGKMIFGLRVLSSDGHSINGGQAALRNFFRLLDLSPMVPIGFLFGLGSEGISLIPTCMIGLITMSVSRNYQRMGDLVADTIVVNVERKWVPELATFSDPRVAQLAAELPSSFIVRATLAQCLSDYVDQRRYLPGARISEIARHLGHPLAERFGLQPDTNHDLLLCALYYKTFIATDASDRETDFVGQVAAGIGDVAEERQGYDSQVGYG